MTTKIDRQFAPRLTPTALAELDAFHATDLARWMDRRAQIRVAATEAIPRVAWRFIEDRYRLAYAKARAESPQYGCAAPGLRRGR